MTIYHSLKEAEQAFKRIQDTSEARLSALRDKIDARKERGLGYDELLKELAQARRIAENSEKIAQKNLDEARTREDLSTQARETAQAQKLAELNQERKALAGRVWAANGGTPAEFEAAWPTMRQELLVRDALADIPQVRAEKTGFDRL